MNDKGTLKYLVKRMLESSDKAGVTEDHLWYAIRNAISPELVISNLAEALRVPAAQMEQLLAESGFGDLVAQGKLSRTKREVPSEFQVDYLIASKEVVSPFPDLFSIEFSPTLHEPIKVLPSQRDAASLLVETLVQSADSDAFLRLYRGAVREYCEDFIASDARLIDDYLANQFSGGYPRYIVNSGIGANEQSNHFVAHINNVNPGRRSTWLIISSPRHLVRLPSDATTENTLFMEFSRSGKTEETVKIHEYTPREAKRIVFANSGPLREIGLRDDNLVLDLPDQVAGRFGRNKTPILLAPMYVAGMDVERYWKKIEDAICILDLSSPTSLPILAACFVYLHQQKNNINHIYLGCNDDVLTFSADELLQFWNEGVNKDGNDISMSRYFGLLRDSHANIEGILANFRTKMAIFLLRENMCPSQLPPMTSSEIDPIDENHVGLCFGDEERILAEANYQRFSEVMPTIKILVHGDLTLDHSAVLGQLWSDLTFAYSRMMNVDPGSNPEVKFVRDRSARLLAEGARKVNKGERGTK